MSVIIQNSQATLYETELLTTGVRFLVGRLVGLSAYQGGFITKLYEDTSEIPVLSGVPSLSLGDTVISEDTLVLTATLDPSSLDSPVTIERIEVWTTTGLLVMTINLSGETFTVAPTDTLKVRNRICLFPYDDDENVKPWYRSDDVTPGGSSL